VREREDGGKRRRGKERRSKLKEGDVGRKRGRGSVAGGQEGGVAYGGGNKKEG